MRKLQTSARRWAVGPRAPVARRTAWARSLIARLGMQPRQGPPVDMVWRRRQPAPQPGEIVRERSMTRLAPVVNLHLSVRPLIRNQWQERIVEHASKPLFLASRAERRMLPGHSRTDHIERHTRERLVLAPREDSITPATEPEALRARHTEAREERPQVRLYPNVGHAFDRLLIRRERATQEQAVERILRRSRRVEEAVTPPPSLALPKPAAPGQRSAAVRAERSAARRKSREKLIPSQREAMQAQWAAALDPNRLADQVLREMDRRLVARKERFGRL